MSLYDDSQWGLVPVRRESLAPWYIAVVFFTLLSLGSLAFGIHWQRTHGPHSLTPTIEDHK